MIVRIDKFLLIKLLNCKMDNKIIVLLLLSSILLTACQLGLTEEEFQGVIKAVKKASVQEIPKNILEGVDINSAKGVFLSYRIALQSYDKEEFNKHISSQGVKLFHDSNELIQFEIDNDNFDESVTNAFFYIPTLNYINISNEFILEPFAYLSLKDRTNKYRNGQVKLVREDGKWMVINETWIFRLPWKFENKSIKELVCEQKIIKLTVVFGETKICQKSEGTKKTIEFYVDNIHGRFQVIALNITIFGENQNNEYNIEKIVEPGFVIYDKVNYDTSIIGDVKNITISPHVMLGEFIHTCNHKNSSIELDVSDIKECG